ncbi:Non-repetitive/WGA-negative nucleoporin C-terminal-domain-containing protein [Infundibulicybe gibba]|nr:Non-repetitive/WGA-negative nucleoporin C-terminal-domain-containing protein [Infundibulicybe gibba]
MATFSPSPAPRRSSRLRPPANSPPRRIRVTGQSKPPSRLVTPARQLERSPYIADNVSFASGMDVDEGSSVISERSSLRTNADTIFAQSHELSVSFYANLPVEVKQVLKNADFYGDAYSGDIDTLTGFALVASIQTCFVWQHAQAVKGTPTCYIFACPQDYNQTMPPFHGLVPYGSSREPGLILVTSAGEIRFWDSIGIGLAGGEHFTTTDLGLSSDEQVTNFMRCDAQTYVASTTSGTLFRLILTSAGGKYHLASHAFSRPTPSMSFSRLIPSIFSTSTPSSRVISAEPGNISSITMGAQTSTGGRDIWALVDTRVQRWDMKSEGWEELLIDSEITNNLRIAVRETFGEGVEKDNARLDLELVDLAIDSDGGLVILVSYAGTESYLTMDMGGVRRMYALIRATCLGETFKVDNVKSVPYQSTSTSGAPMHPRIQLLLGGKMIAIQFGDAVALCARDSDYRDRLELKSATDRTLGVGVVVSDSSLLILTAATMMKATLDIDRVSAFDSDTGHANLVKSTMMQAIIYGSLADNPLHFSFPPEVDEDSLMLGAEQLSQEILESSPEIVRGNHDLTTQLAGRKERLSWLIRFINDNVVLVKMSQRSRQKLATDAEKLYACHQLWLQHNELLASSPNHSVLNDAVHSYMHNIEESDHEDIMRAFFRLRVGDIGRLITKIPEVAVQVTRESDHDLASLLPEANRVVLTVLKSAFDYREYNFGVYGIELPMIKPWTSRPSVIDVVLGLFDASTKVVDSPDTDTSKDSEPNTQLPDLAGVLFACLQERLDWLGSAVAANEQGAERDKNELTQKFSQLRPEVLETLRRNGHAEAAFDLAEKYRDFTSLAALCHRDNAYPPEENPNAPRIQSYIERFKEEFTTELYRWYIQHGELRLMFSQADTNHVYMDRFFTEHPHPSISWIHDLGKERHSSAAAALLAEAEHATNLEVKHLMLSIGKLSHLAQLHETDMTTDESVLDAFHDGLDFVSVHETLLKELKSALDGVRGRQTLENQIDIIAKKKAGMLAEKYALTQLFRNLVRELLHGKALSVEDIVDVLTLKDNDSALEDYATALHLLVPVENLPEARKMAAVRTVWRRIYIHDDWDAIRKTTNISDSSLVERFRHTALYAAFRSILPQQHPSIYDTPPDVALMTPTAQEISSRWPGMSPDQVEGIVADYNLECDVLGELELGDVYDRVRELAETDMWDEEHEGSE